MKIFLKSILFLSTTLLTVNASDVTRQVWSQRDDHFLFSFDEKSNILISESCFNEKITLDKSKCAAAIALKSPKSITVPVSAFAGAKNPGAVACSAGLHKTVRVLKDYQENENAFCVFEDGSMISVTNLELLFKD